MFGKLTSQTSFALLLCLSLFISACKQQPATEPPAEPTSLSEAVIVLTTDSDEWRVQLFKEHLLYSEAVATKLPAPWVIPTREDAQILKTLDFSHEERFVTSDGYTFGMPSSSVSKAGQKTKYSVLGLHRRKSVIDVAF